jgi:hypothetical protein
MRSFSACRGLLSTATVIGAALFSVTASAATLTPLPTIYDFVAKTMTIGVSVADGPPNMWSVLFFKCTGPFGGGCDPLRGGPVSNGVTLVTVPLLRAGAHTITAVYSAEDPVTHETLTARVSFTVEVPVWSWELIPTVFDLLSD